MQKIFKKELSFAAKGLAIILMLVYHLFENEELVTSMGVIHAPFSLGSFLTLTGFGNVCVSVFVFLTAYGISTGLFVQEDAFSLPQAYRQATKRFIILMANFAVLYLSANLLWWYKFDYQSLYGINKQGFLFFVTDAAGMSMFFGTPSLNPTWWYMEIAYILIFLVPLLAWIVKKLGYHALLPICFLPFTITVLPDAARYLFVAAFGVCAAYGHWLDRLLNLKLHIAFQWLIGIVGFILCVLIRQNYVVYEYYLWLADAPIALFTVYLGGVLIGTAPIFGRIFTYIGKHSMNIYLVHTFFYMMLWQKYIYCFKYAGITFLLLLSVCLLYSVLLEQLKRITGLKKLIERYRAS